MLVQSDAFTQCNNFCLVKGKLKADLQPFPTSSEQAESQDDAVILVTDYKQRVKRADLWSFRMRHRRRICVA